MRQNEFSNYNWFILSLGLPGRVDCALKYTFKMIDNIEFCGNGDRGLESKCWFSFCEERAYLMFDCKGLFEVFCDEKF